MARDSFHRNSGNQEPEEAGIARRGFLKAAGFSFAGAFLAGCSQTPVEKAIPYLIEPEGIVPGRAEYYASTCGACPAGCGLLVKNRDGRPLKLEGNPDHPVSRGGLCAVGQASILGLYDSQRLKNPLRDGQQSTWEAVDREILERLARIRAEGGAVRLLTGTINSPTARGLIDKFLAPFPDARHVSYDAVSRSAVLDAHERTVGARVLPRYRFERAEVIVSFDADFLGAWISPVEYTAGYQAGRRLEVAAPRPSNHVQFESRMSLTGSKADRRFRIAAHELGAALAHLTALIAARAGEPFDAAGAGEPPIPREELSRLADELWNARGRSLIVCGSQDVDAQVLCNYVNHLLGNYGATIDIERPAAQSLGDDGALQTLLGELEQGKVAALFIAGVNPVYELPAGDALSKWLRNTSLVVNLAERLDETAAVSGFVCPDHHYLESWGDREPVRGVLGLVQPCSEPFGTTRQMIESFAVWTGAGAAPYDLVREHWRREVYPRAGAGADFRGFWDGAVQNGVVDLGPGGATLPSGFDAAAVKPVTAATPEAGGYTLVLYPKVGLRDGRHAYNPWLQELPDPITKITWDNYACLAPEAAKKLGVVNGDVVRIEADGAAMELPALVQPGQHETLVAVALGYGGKASERFALIGPQWLEGRPTVGENGRVGVNAAPFLSLDKGELQPVRGGVRITPTGAHRELAATQTYDSLEVPKHLAPPGGERRPAVLETTLETHTENMRSGARREEEHHPDLWPEDHPYTGHHWALAIDLNACTGCSACLIACQVENNVAVVGRDEVLRRREMHWIRIDRYYSGEGDDVEVAHQPMMCQQCDNAPCETVCPVLATVHSEEGLNEQIYNRCVGTRYCANNCPYKVRRFNWFEYAHEDTLENLVLNPDVTVRSRGVMEKCTFCVQRIQAARIEAKGRGEPLRDGDIRTACQQGCPASAIVFGDSNDPNSRVSALLDSPRTYEVLGEINVKPSVGYLKLVRRRGEGKEDERHG